MKIRAFLPFLHEMIPPSTYKFGNFADAYFDVKLQSIDSSVPVVWFTELRVPLFYFGEESV